MQLKKYIKIKYILIIYKAILLININLVLHIKTEHYFSQPDSKQDKYLNENIFKNKKNGYFIDIGAHDGITYSNTYFFEKKLGWKGICIEPMPGAFNKLKKNRSCICINGCIAEEPIPAKFLLVSGPSEMLSGLIDFYHPEHLKRIEAELNSLGGTSEIIEIQSYRLDAILSANKIKYVDYLSIDTEGSELSILKSINFDTVDIFIISVENNYKDKTIKTFLESKKYKFIKQQGGDEIYYKKPRKRNKIKNYN